MTALFSIVDTFTLTGRGFVLAGEIVEGVVKRGMFVAPPPDGVAGRGPIEVVAVEAILRRGDDGEIDLRNSIGLVLKATSSEADHFAQWNWKGHVVLIEEREP